MTQNTLSALNNAINTFNGIKRASALGQQAVPNGQGQAALDSQEQISFTVVSSNSQQITLKDNANQQRFILPSNALTLQQSGVQNSPELQKAQQSVASSQAYLPKAGDTLILLSANDSNVRFRLLPAPLTKPASNTIANSIDSISNTNNVLPIKLNRALVDTWPDVSLNVVSKAGLSIVAQSSLESNSKNANALSKVLTENALKLGKPLIELALSGKVTKVQSASNTLSFTQLQVSLNTDSGQKLKLDLPLPERLQSDSSMQKKVTTGSNVDVLLSPTKTKANIQAVQVQNLGKFKNSDLTLANELNPQLPKKLRELSENSLLNLYQLRSTGSRSNDNVLVQGLPKNILNTLPQALTASVKSLLNAQQLEEARLVVLPEQTLNRAKQIQSKGISLIVVAKPQVVNVSTDVLLSDSKTHSLLKTGSPIDNPNTRSSGSIDLKASSKTPQPPSISGGQNPVAKPLENSGALLYNLKQQLSAQEISNLGPQLKRALQHTISHSEPSAPIVKEIKQSVDSLLKNSGTDTKAVLQPLANRLSLLLGSQQASVQSNSIKSNLGGISQPMVNSNAEGTEDPQDAEPDITSLLRTTIGAKAITSLMQNTQAGPQNNLIDGLVSLLRMNLIATLSKSASFAGLSSALKAGEVPITVATFANNIIKHNKPNGERVNATRVIQDLAAGDIRGNLIAQIGKLLSSHNSQKLRSAEASLQGQDTFYYSFPNLLNTHHEDIQMMLKREYDSNGDGKDDNQSVTRWNLNIKLDIGEQGEVLAKTRVTVHSQHEMSNQDIDLHLYASDEALKTKVLKYLPMLQQRLLALGITVNTPSCDIGKADPKLFKTKLEVMNTYA